MSLGEADLVEQLKQARDGIVAALLADALNPKLNYDIDGQSVDRTSWRANLTDELRLLQMLILSYEPFEIQTIMVN
jgi:hypothetical protein